ncbi:MAG: sialate O-acetylesterase, partial [Gemmataceae bacterium]
MRNRLAVMLLWVAAGTAVGQEGSKTLPKPDDKPGAAGKPIQVFILMGQSNMVGMGDIDPPTAKGTLQSLTTTDKKYPFLL